MKYQFITQLVEGDYALIFNEEFQDYQNYEFSKYFFSFFNVNYLFQTQELQKVIVLTSKYHNFYNAELNDLNVLSTTKNSQENSIQVAKPL